MANVNYDTLSIEIKADSKQANNSITRLSNNLEKLENVAKNLDTEAIKNIEKVLQDISKIDFSNVSQGLNDVVNAFKYIKQQKGEKDPQETLKNQFLAGMNVDNNVRFTDPAKIGQIDLDDTTAGKEELAQTEQSVNRIVEAMRKIGTTALWVLNPIKQLKKQMGGAEKETNKSAKGFQKFMKAFGRVAFYRIVRRLLQLIAQMIKQGIQNMAQFDSEFNQTMSNLKSSFEYVKNALGTMIAPIIQLLEPILTFLMDAFGDLANKIGEIMSAVNGKDTFAKATKSAEDYAKALNKASLGIDELNVIQTGGSFEETAISDEAKDTAKDVRGIIEEIKGIIKEIMPLVKLIIDTAKDFIKRILPMIKPILEPIKRIIGMIVNLLTILVENTNESVNDSLIQFTEMVGQILDFVAELVNQLMPALVGIINVISPALNVINRILEYAFTLVGKLLQGIKQFLPILQVIVIPLGFILELLSSILIVLEGVIRTMRAVVNWDFASIPAIWNDVSANLQKSWTDWAQAQGGVFNYGENGVGTYNQATASGDYYTNASGSQGSSGSNNSDVEVAVYLDSDQIANRVEKRMRNSGANMFRGGTLTYGK